VQRDNQQRNVPVSNSLEGLPFVLKTLVSSHHLNYTDIHSLASTSSHNARLFSSDNSLLWNSLLKRDFNTECAAGQSPKQIYRQLQERQRLITYTQFFLNPIKRTVAPATLNALPQPWFVRFQGFDKSRYHAMAVLRDLILENNHDGFINAARSHMEPIDDKFLNTQATELCRVYEEVFQVSAYDSLKAVTNHLITINQHHEAGREINRLSKTHNFVVMISLLSKCGALRSLEILLSNLRINPLVLKMFYDRFGAELCIDAIYYHRPALVKLLLSSQHTNNDMMQITPNNSSDDLISINAPENYAAANTTAYSTEYTEDTMLTPLPCALNSLRKFYHRASAAEIITPWHTKTLFEFQQMISLLLHAHANPERALVEFDLDTRMYHVSLTKNARDLAREVLQEVQLDRRLDEKFQLNLSEILESVLCRNALEFTKAVDHVYDFSSDNSSVDDEEQITPTKRTKLDQLSLRSPRN
jgi:hypothetical protein